MPVQYTHFQKALKHAPYIDANTLVGENNLPDLVPDVLAINNSLYNLLSCPLGSRLFQPEYGSRLWQLLFEPVDAQTATEIRSSFIQSIERWEPRIILDRGRTAVQV